ncbi:MAG TPA: D-amino-acid transaminase [Roseiarcus sp.]|jgi:D-alanine transaminase
MSRIAYVNGRYVRFAQAAVSIEDRAFQFGDGVYEVCEVRGGLLIDETRHLDRLRSSLEALRIAAPVGPSALRQILREIVARNRVREGIAYVQISRGVARRDHGFPAASVRSGLVVSARSLDPRIGQANAERGVRVVTTPDERWAHPHIKTLQLLPNVLAKQAAREAGAMEAWFVDRAGYITEGSSTNAWIVAENGVLVTRPADRAILRGVTRMTLLDVVAREGVAFEERAFTLEETYRAREAFYSSATTIATPVVAIDGRRIGDGTPGPLTLALRRQFHDAAERG